MKEKPQNLVKNLKGLVINYNPPTKLDDVLFGFSMCYDNFRTWHHDLFKTDRTQPWIFDCLVQNDDHPC